jgi:ABC-type branched-subunit amino acid transport system permease subunit
MCTRKRAFVLALLAFLLLFPLVSTNDYQLRLVTLMAINALAAIGLNLVKGYAGQVSVGQHGLYAIGAYATAILSAKLGLPPALSIPGAIAVAGIAGVIVGLPSLRIQGAYLAIATMGFAESVRIILNSWDWAGSSMGLAVPPLSIGPLLLDTPIRFYYAVLFISCIAIWFSFNLVNSAFGRAMMAVREDPLAASVGGIDLRHYKLIAFVLSATFGGLAGALQAHVTGFVHPDNYTLLLMVMLMLMIVVGGLGSITGSIIGAVVVTLLYDVSRAYVQVQMMIFATVLILALRYLPGGLISLGEKHTWRFFTRKKLAAKP